MGKAIGMVEYKTVSTGIQAADLMVKTAEVEILEAQTVCPGKYIVILQGQLSAITASVEAAKAQFRENFIDSFILGNPHESIFSAIYGASEIDNIRALGILETFSVASIIVAADEAAKSAEVKLIELRLARGMCGKSYLMLTGEIAAVEAAVERAVKSVSDDGMVLDYSVIASPDKKLCETIL